MPYHDYTGQLQDLLSELQDLSGVISEQQQALDALSYKLAMMSGAEISFLIALALIGLLIWFDVRGK